MTEEERRRRALQQFLMNQPGLKVMSQGRMLTPQETAQNRQQAPPVRRPSKFSTVSSFADTAADKIGGGFGRQFLKSVDYLVPGYNTLGTGRARSFAEDWDKRAIESAARQKDQAAARAGLRFGSVVKGVGDVGLLVAPAAAAEKAVKATRFAANLEKTGKVGRFASGALQRGAGSLAATGAQTSIDIGQGRNPELAKNLGIGVGIDVVGSPIVGKAWRAIAAGPTIRALAKSSDVVDVASRLSKRYPSANPDELAKIANEITAQSKAKDVRKTLKNFEKTGGTAVQSNLSINNPDGADIGTPGKPARPATPNPVVSVIRADGTKQQYKPKTPEEAAFFQRQIDGFRIGKGDDSVAGTVDANGDRWHISDGSQVKKEYEVIKETPKPAFPDQPTPTPNQVPTNAPAATEAATPSVSADLAQADITKIPDDIQKKIINGEALTDADKAVVAEIPGVTKKPIGIDEAPSDPNLTQKLSPDYYIRNKITQPIERAVNKGIFALQTSDNPIARGFGRLTQGVSREAGLTPEALASRRLAAGQADYGKIQGQEIMELGNALDSTSKAGVYAALDPEQASKLGIETPKNLTPEQQVFKKQIDGVRTETTRILQDAGLITEKQASNANYLKREYSIFNDDPGFSEGKKASQGFLIKREKDISQDVLDTAITDPSYLAGKHYAEAQQAVAMVDYTNRLAGMGYVSDVPKPGYVKLPVSKLYGEASGKYMPKTFAEDFQGFQYSNGFISAFNDMITAYDSLGLRRAKKQLLTVFNPAVRLGNQLGNRVMFSQMGGINPITFNKEYIMAAKLIQDKSPIYREAIQQGLFGTDITMADFGKRLQASGVDDNAVKDAIGWFQKSYSGADDKAKLAAYKIWRDRGYNVTDAATMTQRAFQDYRSVGFFYDMAAKTPIAGNAFVRFAGDSIRIAKNAAVDHPLRSAATISAWAMFVNGMSKISGESAEDKKTREDRFGAPKIPFTDISLTVQTPLGEVNLARFIPFYQLNDVGNEFSRFLPVQQNPFRPQGWQDPLLGQVGQVITDTDFRGKSIRDPERFAVDEKGNKVDKFPSQPLDKNTQKNNLLRFAWNQNVPLGREADSIKSAYQGKEDIYGKVRTPTQAWLRAGGVKVEQFGAKEAQTTRERNAYFDDRKEIDAIANNMNKEARDTFKKYVYPEKKRDGTGNFRPPTIYDAGAKAKDLLKYPEVFEGLRQKAILDNQRDGKPIHPMFDPKYSEGQRKEMLRLQSLQNDSYGNTERKASYQLNPWLNDYATESSKYYDDNEAWFEKLKAKLPADKREKMEAQQDYELYGMKYPEASKELSAKMTALKGITDPEQRGKFYEENPEVIEHYRNMDKYERVRRQAHGAPLKDGYPEKSKEVENYEEAYFNLPKGDGKVKRDGTRSSPTRSAWINSHPKEWKAMTDYWNVKNQYDLQESAALAQYEGIDLTEEDYATIGKLANAAGGSGGGSGFQFARTPKTPGEWWIDENGDYHRIDNTKKKMGLQELLASIKKSGFDVPEFDVTPQKRVFKVNLPSPAKRKSKVKIRL